MDLKPYTSRRVVCWAMLPPAEPSTPEGKPVKPSLLTALYTYLHRPASKADHLSVATQPHSTFLWKPPASSLFMNRFQPSEPHLVDTAGIFENFPLQLSSLGMASACQIVETLRVQPQGTRAENRSLRHVNSDILLCRVADEMVTHRCLLPQALLRPHPEVGAHMSAFRCI